LKFPNPQAKILFFEQMKQIFNCLTESITFMVNKWERNFLDRVEDCDSDFFVVGSNRDAERYISWMKQILNQNPNTRLIVIISKCKLRTLDFEFSGLNSNLKEQLKQHGRNLYNNSITRGHLQPERVFTYFQELEIKKEKAVGDYKKLTIQHFLAQKNLLKDNETVKVVNMKEVLKKLKDEGIFTEKVVDTKRDGLLKLFFETIIHLDIPKFN
jgi:hypothetical protein